MGQNPAGFFFRFFLAAFILYASPCLSSDEAEDRYFQTNQLHHRLGLSLVGSLSLFHQYSFISKTQPQAISRFLSKFSILSVLGIAAVTCFIFYAYWENLIRANWKK